MEATKINADSIRDVTVIDSKLKTWDGETVITHFDRPSGATIIIALHSSRLGPATGGTRMKNYPDFESALNDALRLSTGMTYKFAVSDFPRGGGKAVIWIPKKISSQTRTGLLQRYGKLIKKLNGMFYTGPDIGTSPADMDIIAETGAPYVHSRTPRAGGAGSSGPFTALGVFTGIQAACQHVFGNDTLAGRRVLVQGAGSVGQKLIEYLISAKAEVLFSDINEEIIRKYRDETGLEFVPPEKLFDIKCDVFSPCALGNVISRETIERLKCRIVAGGANNQLTETEDAQRLQAKKILYAPDYVINIGGAMAITGMESMGWSRREAEKQVVESVRNALERIFEMTASEGITTEAAARRLAEERLNSVDKE